MRFTLRRALIGLASLAAGLCLLTRASERSSGFCTEAMCENCAALRVTRYLRSGGKPVSSSVEETEWTAVIERAHPQPCEHRWVLAIGQ